MWPFNKRTSPISIIHKGIKATFCAEMEIWEFTVNDLVFNCHGLEIDTFLIDSAESIANTIEEQASSIHKAIQDFLTNDHYLNTDSVEVLSIDLSEYGDKDYISIGMAGDDWGDFGVEVTLQKNKIIAVDGGD